MDGFGGERGGTMDEREQALEAEFRSLFQRILELGREQGERGAFNRIIAMAQSAIGEGRLRAEARPPGGDGDRPMTAQGRNPLRPIQ